ncbi:hypothetical protein BD769DRAFT_1729349 [Suillus cothurnatus]|nr:hypothetical protein BD769DRAFT_1729349 [Suillus cothurnatus]
MGHKDQRDDLKEALWKKDEQVTSLEARVDAYIARTSDTQAHLLKTIDTVNSLEAQHAIDLAAKEFESVTLTHEIEHWRTFAKVLEVERDDLKDVVEDLIQEVQMFSDRITLPGTELDISSSAFNDVLRALLSNSSAQYTYTKAFETLDVTALFNGTSAANYDVGGAHKHYNGVPYSESTNSLLPAVNDSNYSGSPVAQTAIGFAFMSGFVPRS